MKKILELNTVQARTKTILNKGYEGTVENWAFFYKSWFIGMQQFSFNPAPFTKECHLISDRLVSMEI